MSQTFLHLKFRFGEQFLALQRLQPKQQPNDILDSGCLPGESPLQAGEFGTGDDPLAHEYGELVELVGHTRGIWTGDDGLQVVAGSTAAPSALLERQPLEHHPTVAFDMHLV